MSQEECQKTGAFSNSMFFKALEKQARSVPLRLHNDWLKTAAQINHLVNLYQIHMN